ncbi:MAG: VOC family protein [Gammaproteobacteria bacterium]|nr:VOC family protein [Gammaproteobacteria bacterium]
MISKFRALLLVAVACVANSSDAESDDNTRLVHDTLRTTFIVSDYDRAYALFHDVLGLPIDLTMDLDGEVVNELMGQTGRPMRIAIFNVDGTTSGRVAILAYLDEKNTEAVHRDKLDPGAAVLVFETTNIDEISQRVTAAGYPILAGPSVLFPQPLMKTQALEMMFIGPDGIAINLIQRGIPLDSEQ